MTLQTAVCACYGCCGPFPTCGGVSLYSLIHSRMQWYLTAAVICVFLMTDGVESFFMYLLALCISSFVKCPFKSFVHFLTKKCCLRLLLSCRVLCILGTNLSSDKYVVNIFSHFMASLFIFWMVFFDEQMF